MTQVMMCIVSALSSGKLAFILMLVIVILTIIDSQFVNVFYGTDLGTPGNLHLLLFVSLIVIASIINTMSLGFVKSNDSRETTSRTLLHRIAYFGTVALQSATVIIMLIIISEMLVFHNYDKLSSLLVVYFSHLWSSFILGLLSLRFIQWYRISKSFSLLIYGVVFGVIIFITIITLPLLTEQFINQPQSIYPRHYIGLIAAVIVPSRDIAFIYGLGNYVLPLLIILSWILTVLLLKTYIDKIGKKKFWLIVSIPLIYQLFSFVVRDSNLVSDPALVEIFYSQQFQFLFAISYQVSGSFFAIALLGVARKMKQKGMKNYLIISSIGIICLFSSVQPGMPFYAAYPPFGLVTLLFLGLSSYLLLIGILGCAANVSRDNELRREIYKGLVDSDMFKNMGMAEMQLEMEKKVLPLVSNIELLDDMRSMEPNEEDVKTMINDVLNELYSKRSHIKSGK
ncbi:MAG: hypothetical protein JO297_10000 [Nitrososphaeraceae archaeon]|nr:hypothetical protein [Nitrososphaeraceae archaeon]